MKDNWRKAADSGHQFDWSRSFSEPDLTVLKVGPTKEQSNRFTIKHPHEYICVDDLKFFRRKRPADSHTRSQLRLSGGENESVLPFDTGQSEYRTNFRDLVDACKRPHLLRRATSLHLEGLMNFQSEQQAQFHWYTPQDWDYCRTYPIRNPSTVRVGLNNDDGMEGEYRSSYITYPMVDRTAKILPREMFRFESEPNTNTTIKSKTIVDQSKIPPKRIPDDHSPDEIAALNKLAEDKFKRDLAAQEQQKCHLQQRAALESKHNTMPSEYKRQYVQFPMVEKAHSIPQISHIQIQGDFVAVPEYQDNFRKYTNYSKSAPIKKLDNLKMSGSEVGPKNRTDENNENIHPEIPEYRDQYCLNPPKRVPKTDNLKMNDTLYPRGKFSKDIPEYNESFRDPEIRQVPERGKCREPYLRLKGKLEFNPEYRNTYLDFPRARPIVRKPASSIRLPISNNSTTTTSGNTSSTNMVISKSPKQSPRQVQYSTNSPKHFRSVSNVDTASMPLLLNATAVTQTPEYRRATYNYQLRERTPTRKITEIDYVPATTVQHRKTSDSSSFGDEHMHKHKKRSNRNRHASILDPEIVAAHTNPSLGINVAKKPARFGRRATLMQNAANCRDKSSIVEGNPKYALNQRNKRGVDGGGAGGIADSFVVLNEPCGRSNWMKKSWYES